MCSPPTSTLLIRLLPILLAFAGAGCDGAPSDVLGGARVERLVLRPLTPLPDEARARTVARIELPLELGAWQVEGGKASLAPADDGSGARGLVVTGPERKVVTIPGHFDPRAFHRIAIMFSTLRPVNLSAHLSRGEERAVSSEVIKIEAASGPSPVLFDFPRLARQEQPFDRLTLVFQGKGQQSIDGAIELVYEPPGSLLPDPADGPAMVDVGGELRRGFGLVGDRVVEGELAVPRRASLEFAYGLPEVRGAASSTTLRLTIEPRGGGEERQELTYRLGPSPWRRARVPLDDFSGDTCRFRFALEPAGEGVAVAALAEARVVATSAAPPTVLLVTSDTHRADHVGAAGAGVPVSTPALDALAARGVLFEDCFTSINVTNPSHIALMTATSPRDTGIVDNYRALAEEAPTLAERFHEAGFVTFASVSAPHLGDPTSGLGQGFDRMSFPPANRDAAATIAPLEAWLADAEGLPLFVWLHVFDAHGPYEPPEPFASRSYPPERDPFDPTAPLPDVPESAFPPELAGLKDLEYPKAMYRGEVSYLDGELRRLFERERFARGLIAVTADHGESFGEHGIYYGHEGLYPATVHVPLILAWPGAPAGARVSEPVRQTEIGRTLLDLAGLEGADFPGRSLLALLRGDAGPDEPRFALGAHHTAASITARGWHLVLHLRMHAPVYGTKEAEMQMHQVQLYDLRADPECAKDLVAAETARAASLREQLVRWLTERRELGWSGRVSQDTSVLRQLAQLGYTTEDTGDAGAPLIDAECSCAWCRRF